MRVPPSPESPECYFMPKCARHRPTAVGARYQLLPAEEQRFGGGSWGCEVDSVQPVESINHFLICGMQSVAEWNAAVAASTAGRVALSVPHGQLGYVFPPSRVALLVGLGHSKMKFSHL